MIRIKTLFVLLRRYIININQLISREFNFGIFLRKKTFGSASFIIFHEIFHLLN